MNYNIISIIMPLYNTEPFLQESIESVLFQTYIDWELIIVDDCSTDNSFRLAEDLSKKDNRIKLYKMSKNSGVAKVRNFAISKSSGRYIAFLDSDDLWHKNKLEIQLAFMKSEDIPFSFTAFSPIKEDGTPIDQINYVPIRLTYSDLLKETVIGCLTVMYDREVVKESYFDTTLDKHEDYQCWLEILKKIEYGGGLDEVLAYYRVRESSLSSNKLISASYVWKIMYHYQNIPFFKAIYYFSSYAFNAVIKYRGRNR